LSSKLRLRLAKGFFFFPANLLCKRDGKKRFFFRLLYFLPSPKWLCELLLSKISIAYAIGGFHKDRYNDNSSIAKLVLPAVRKKNFDQRVFHFKSQKEKTDWMAQYLTEKKYPCAGIIMINFILLK
jgi:hypothetical protein